MTADPPPIDWTEDGRPRSALYGDAYFGADDGLSESRAVFLEGCGLPGAWAGRQSFTVAELGFGTGLNMLALLDLWRREGPTEYFTGVFGKLLNINWFILSRIIPDTFTHPTQRLWNATFMK
jgi:tRNA 5-methylaminomethyl-2-thiouridine biosynthesis bifunctional protein